MSTAIARAALGMAHSLERLAGVEGVYARGETESEPIVGIPVQHEYEVIDDETGLPTKVISYDWTFIASELEIADERITPRKGDRWQTTIEGVDEIYEVQPIGKRPCFERADASGVILIVHTKSSHMSSILLAVADALAADLTGHSFSVPFSAARTYADAEYQLDAADDSLQCDVVPASELKTELDDRGTVRYLASAFVVFRRKFAGGDIEQVGTSEQTRVKASAVDPLVGLVEEANEWLTAQERLTNQPEAVWNSTNIEAAVVHKHLREWSQFTGIIKTTYEVPKPL